jgi:hypothetical protein
MTHAAMIPDRDVERCALLIERSGVAAWLEEELRARRRRPGRPRELNVAALLVALLLLATDDRALHLSAVTDVLFSRLSKRARTTLEVTGVVRDRRSFLARYRQVRYLFSKVASVLDPSGLVKNRRLSLEEFAQRCCSLSEEEEIASCAPVLRNSASCHRVISPTDSTRRRCRSFRGDRPSERISAPVILMEDGTCARAIIVSAKTTEAGRVRASRGRWRRRS